MVGGVVRKNSGQYIEGDLVMIQKKWAIGIVTIWIGLLFGSVQSDAATRRVPQDYSTIQAAVTACASGDIVLIAAGTYTGSGNRGITFPTINAITIRSVSGPATCIIDCDHQAQAFFLKSPNPATARFEGLTIREGRLDGTYYPAYGRGGGISVNSTDATIENCAFEDCIGAQFGGALSLYWGESTVSNCTFERSTMTPVGSGGAIAAVGGDYTIIDCHFDSNSCQNYGGGLYLGAARGSVSRCVFVSNSISTIGGGGLGCNETLDMVVSNCAFAGNSAPEGSAIYTKESSLAFESCTAAYNIWVGATGGLYAEGATRPIIRNSIFYSNGGGEIVGGNGDPVVSYSNVQGSGVYPGTGNINADPRLAYGPEGEFYLNQTTSPCLNTGSGPSSGVCFETSMGEYCQDDMTTSNGGAFDTGVVDMGCHFVSQLPTPTPAISPSPTPTRSPTRTPTPTFTIPPTATMCVGSTHETTIFEEYFESWPLTGWTIEDHGDACIWESTATTGRPNYAGGGGQAAIADSEWCGGVQTVTNTDLISPVLNLSAYSEASLDMIVAFQAIETDFFEIKVSSNGGATYADEVLLWEETTHSGMGPGQPIRLNITPWISSQTRFKINYRTAQECYWVVIDNVQVKVCVPNTTPTSTPTRTPTITPSPTPPPPSPTPTTGPGEPTNTPPPASPTPADCSILGCSIDMPSHDYVAGDPCSCDVTVCNTTGAILTDIPVFVLLDVYGSYFFAPDYSAFNYYMIPLPPGPTVINVLPIFTWPSGVGAADGIKWYAAMTNPGISELYGELDSFEFGWH